MAQDHGSHRLSSTVRPLDYDLHLEVDPDADGFAGRVALRIVVAEPASVFHVHSLDLEWHSVHLELDGTTAPRSPQLTTDVEREWVELRFDEPVPAGEATLFVEYSGVYCENLVGLYVSEMDLGGERRRIAVTQCESTHARRILPCFDEPEFKATFSVTLVVPEALVAVSNGAELERRAASDPAHAGRVEIRFAPTMVMSSYLLAVVVGPLEITEGDPVPGRDGDIALRVVHPPGKRELCGFALEVATHALGFFEEYYDLPYPGDKVDLVAIPDFAFGAMENLGCITFREVLLLVDPDGATPMELQRVADVINHELAHMWFGDLVTMKWWNGIWLNEAFATFMEVSASDAFRPEWDVWTTFGLARAAAFETDALWSTRPIEFEVETASESEAMFDILTYEKGCSVLRMFEQYLGAEAFRDGIRSYLRLHAHANTDTTDLWDALEAATGEPVRRIAESWIFTGGHPLVEMTLGDSLVLGQQQALYLSAEQHSEIQHHQQDRQDADDAPADTIGVAPDTTWPVPMTMSIGRADTDATATTDQTLHRVLLEDSLEIPLDSKDVLLRPNVNGSGFYRVLLPRSQRERVFGAVESPLERFSVLDDTWFGVVAGHLHSGEVTGLIRAAVDAGETDPSVWRRIGSVLAELLRLSSPEQRPGRRDWIRSTLRGPRDDFSTADSRGRRGEVAATLLSVMAVLGEEPSATAEARQLFASSASPVGSTAAPDTAVTAAALEVVAHSPTTEEYDEVLRRWRNASTPQDEQRHLGALVATVDPEQFRSALDLCLTEVRTQDAPYVLRRALANPEMGPLAWRFLTENFEQMRTRFPSGALPRMFDGIRGFTDPALAADVASFVRSNPLPSGARSMSQHLERMWASVAAAERIGAEDGPPENR